MRADEAGRAGGRRTQELGRTQEGSETPLEFEIMEAGCRPSKRPPGGWGRGTFSVGIRPVRVSGRKAAAWVRISGPVHNEREIDRETRRALVSLNRDGSAARLQPPLLVGLRLAITAAGKAGGLRRAI